LPSKLFAACTIGVEANKFAVGLGGGGGLVVVLVVPPPKGSSSSKSNKFTSGCLTATGIVGFGVVGVGLLVLEDSCDLVVG
jgi:hypothetical protein